MSLFKVSTYGILLWQPEQTETPSTDQNKFLAEFRVKIKRTTDWRAKGMHAGQSL
jgi:hypothetical protein